MRKSAIALREFQYACNVWFELMDKTDREAALKFAKEIKDKQDEFTKKSPTWQKRQAAKINLKPEENKNQT